MSNLFNSLGFLLALALAAVVSMFPRGTAPRAVGAVPRPSAEVSAAQVITLPNGNRALLDASGYALELRKFQRIASGSTIADALLLEFVSPERIVSFTNYSNRAEMYGHRFEGKPRIDVLANMEALVALHPDLVLVSTLASAPHVQRLREVGLNVFSLGEMRGEATFLSNVRLVAELVGTPELGEHYVQSFQRRFHSVAAGLAPEQRRTGVYLTFYGGKIFGSGAGTSYHDVLVAAGLVDVGAMSYQGWPAWNPEQVLELDPDVIVTRTGLGAEFCANPAFAQMKVCTGRGLFAEVAEEFLNDPGPGMLPAAELVHRQVYGGNK